ncbi:MAG TPA: hypothetical protein VN775_00740 [Opitutaceae bacterium]|nr:hypothetical protein [Opitutaceae bacterium]
MLPTVDFEQSIAVSAFVRAKFGAMYPEASDAWLQQLFDDVDALFAGKHPAYARNDLRYHNLRHTLMAVVCMAVLLEGRHMARDGVPLTARDFELAIAGVLLHDSGYLKLKGDTGGTGAKYTFCHILRSCAFAASFLPELGATDVEIENVLSAINCTGPNSEISRLRFRDPVSRVVGCALATADYLGQLSDPQYPSKLGDLFQEFRESDDFTHVPVERRVFKSESDLICRTPGFWANFVRPKLDSDLQGVYCYLARPLPSGRNDYLAAVDANLEAIDRLIAGMKSAGR